MGTKVTCVVFVVTETAWLGIINGAAKTASEAAAFLAFESGFVIVFPTTGGIDANVVDKFGLISITVDLNSQPTKSIS